MSMQEPLGQFITTSVIREDDLACARHSNGAKEICSAHMARLRLNELKPCLT